MTGRLSLLLGALLLSGCTYHVNYSKNVGQGCSSSVVGVSSTDVQGGAEASVPAQEGRGDLMVAIARSMQTDDRCEPAGGD